jgi:hypothetical protein
MAAVTSNNEFTVTINETGETTGMQYVGEFTVKKRLSLADYAQMDRVTREILGPVAPEKASPRARNIAEVIGELSVRVIKAPLFWTESRGGLDLEDDQPVSALMGAIAKRQDDDSKARKAKADEARAELAKAAAPSEPAK